MKSIIYLEMATNWQKCSSFLPSAKVEVSLLHLVSLGWGWLFTQTVTMGHMPAPRALDSDARPHTDTSGPGQSWPRALRRTPQHSTFKLNGEPRQAHGGIAPKGQEKAVPAALDSVRGLGALEAPDQWAVGVLALIDVQEVIAGLHVEAEDKGHWVKGEWQRLGLWQDPALKTQGVYLLLHNTFKD